MTETYEDVLHAEIKALEALLTEIDPRWRKRTLKAHGRIQASMCVPIRGAMQKLRAAYGLGPEHTSTATADTSADTADQFEIGP